MVLVCNSFFLYLFHIWLHRERLRELREINPKCYHKDQLFGLTV